MTARRVRLLDPSIIPKSLWKERKNLLYLPPILAQAYKTLIERHHLLELANSRNSKEPPVGGIDKQRTDQHFAQQFDGSCARTQLALLDPKQHVSQASNVIIHSLSGNDVCITDAPCGAGAAVLTLLTTVAELRAQCVLPRQPLSINLIGAEISEIAREYASAMLTEIQPLLVEQAIFVNANFYKWDVIDKLSNTDLISQMTLATNSVSKCLLIVANFNNYLVQHRKLKQAEPQLEELFRHASCRDTMVIWIEPSMNTVIQPGGLFHAIMKSVKEKWSQFMQVNTEGDVNDSFPSSDCLFQSLLFSSTHPVHLTVLRCKLSRAPKKPTEL